MSWLRVVLHWTWECSLFDIMISFPLDIYTQEGICWIICYFCFLLLRNFYTIFNYCCANLHCHQQCSRIPFSLYLCQPLLSFKKIIAVLTGVKWYLIVVLISISLVISGAKCFFHVSVGHIYFLWEISISICCSFLKKSGYFIALWPDKILDMIFI
jgi:hypothetical protein